eukprot:181461-Ditylum_brightwellii.AAC.1
MSSSEPSFIGLVVSSKGAGDTGGITGGVLQFEGEIPSQLHVGIGANHEYTSFGSRVADFGEGCPEVIKLFFGFARIWGIGRDEKYRDGLALLVVKQEWEADDAGDA